MSWIIGGLIGLAIWGIMEWVKTVKETEQLEERVRELERNSIDTDLYY